MLKKIQIALLGFGTVGKGVFKTVQTHQHQLKQLLGKPVEISRIVVENIDKHRHIGGNNLLTTEFQDVLTDPDIDVVFEAIVGVEPAATYVKSALKNGKHIITANKEMFAHHGKELKIIAKKNNVDIGFEATTGGGVPIIQTIKQLLQVNHIKKITAILNGTSNYILTEMRRKELSFMKALAQAKKHGFAEADPTNDIEGFDAFYKLMILSDLIFDEQPHWQTVKRIGIKHITKSHIRDLHAQNQRIKSIATLELTDNKIEARVGPQILSENHPLFAVEGVENAIAIEADIVGQLTLSGPGAGALPTASAMIEDLCTILTAKQMHLKHTIITSIPN